MNVPNSTADKKYKKMAYSTTQLFQNANDAHVHFIKQKEWLDYWSYLPYNKSAVESLDEGKIQEIYIWLKNTKSTVIVKEVTDDHIQMLKNNLYVYDFDWVNDTELKNVVVNWVLEFLLVKTYNLCYNDLNRNDKLQLHKIVEGSEEEFGNLGMPKLVCASNFEYFVDND